MKRFDVQLMFSQARLALGRIGAVRAITAVLCLIAIAAWSSVIPELQSELSMQQAKNAVARAGPDAPKDISAAPVRSEDEVRLERFYANLGQQAYLEQQVKALFAIAAKNGLVLSQAEYKPGYNRHGRFHTYQVTFPLKGQYLAIRSFCEQVLIAIPFASLDGMELKRDTIASAALEARLRITFYLAGAQPGMPREGSSDE